MLPNSNCTMICALFSARLISNEKSFLFICSGFFAGTFLSVSIIIRVVVPFGSVLIFTLKCIDMPYVQSVSKLLLYFEINRTLFKFWYSCSGFNPARAYKLLSVNPKLKVENFHPKRRRTDQDSSLVVFPESSEQEELGEKFFSFLLRLFWLHYCGKDIHCLLFVSLFAKFSCIA